MKRRGKARIDVWRTSNYETFVKRFPSIFQTQLHATERCEERNPDNQYDLVVEIFGNQLLGCLSELNDLGRSNRDSTPLPLLRYQAMWAWREKKSRWTGEEDSVLLIILICDTLVGLKLSVTWGYVHQRGFKKGRRSETIAFIEGNTGRPRNYFSRSKVRKNKEQYQVVDGIAHVVCGLFGHHLHKLHLVDDAIYRFFGGRGRSRKNRTPSHKGKLYNLKEQVAGNVTKLV